MCHVNTTAVELWSLGNLSRYIGASKLAFISAHKDRQWLLFACGMFCGIQSETSV